MDRGRTNHLDMAFYPARQRPYRLRARTCGSCALILSVAAGVDPRITIAVAELLGTLETNQITLTLLCRDEAAL